MLASLKNLGFNKHYISDIKGSWNIPNIMKRQEYRCVVFNINVHSLDPFGHPNKETRLPHGHMDLEPRTLSRINKDEVWSPDPPSRTWFRKTNGAGEKMWSWQKIPGRPVVAFHKMKSFNSPLMTSSEDETVNSQWKFHRCRKSF